MNGVYYNTPVPKQTENNQGYIDNILNNNRGKLAIIDISIPYSNKNQDQTFEGIIEQTNKDHIILSNPKTGDWYLIPLIYLAYITFKEPVNLQNQLYT